jgi:hypothetical protein
VGVGEKGKIGLPQNMYTALRKLSSAPFGIGRELVDNKGHLPVGKRDSMVEGSDSHIAEKK